MRIAVLDKEKCTKGKDCDYICQRFCPRVRAGDKTIEIGEGGFPKIDENTCIGCGICIKKCPFDAITIVNLPQELDQPTHQFGMNGFRIFGLPVPKKDNVVGLLGPNGTGKTTAISILSGTMVPNLGNLFDSKWDTVLKHYAGTEMHDYLKGVIGGCKVSVKPQHVVKISQVFKGTVRALLDKVDERGIMQELIKRLELGYVLDNEISAVSGGELQRVAIAACLGKDAQAYFIDEPSSYLDIHQRLNTARIIKQYANGSVFVIEHDLVVLDYLSDLIHVFFGKPGAYGIVSGPKNARVGINVYLEGYLKEENMRFRPEPLIFKPHMPFEGKSEDLLLSFSDIKKKLGKFTLTTGSGVLNKKEVVGIIGANGTGKTTFVKILAGVLPADQGEYGKVTVAYKPQYPQPSGKLVGMLLNEAATQVNTINYDADVVGPLGLREFKLKRDDQLSGGELQRLAIAMTLAQPADLYLFDEPSAFLDVEQRVICAKVIRRVMEHMKATALVVDHDLMFSDYLSDRMLVFSGKPGVEGNVFGPTTVKDGMNRFLNELDITFRRDVDSKRPRANKHGSKLDQEQKSAGEYYHPL